MRAPAKLPRSHARSASASSRGPASAADAAGYTPGGDVGELHGEIIARFAAASVLAPHPPLPVEERVIQAISRAAGWICVAVCLAVAVYLLAE